MNIQNQYTNYIVPNNTRIGHIHLKVVDIERSLAFYHDLLGFEITSRYRDSAVFMSAGGYHHHIAINNWQSKNGKPANRHDAGLYHTAIVYPTRRDLAVIYQRLINVNYPITGATDHLVSEAIYLNDPDGNGLELYWDKPMENWPYMPDGSIDMSSTLRLDLEELLTELSK